MLSVTHNNVMDLNNVMTMGKGHLTWDNFFMVHDVT